MVDINRIYQLDDCVDWLLHNNFRKVVIQLKLEQLKNSTAITEYMKSKYRERRYQIQEKLNDDILDLYVARANTCCVDLLVAQHITDVEAIIHFGQVCLSKPVIKTQKSSPPVLLAFGRPAIDENKFYSNIHDIVKHITLIKQELETERIILLYDTDLIEYLGVLEEKLSQVSDQIEVSKLYCLDQSWETTPSHSVRFSRNEKGNLHVVGHFLLRKPLSFYNCAVYLGKHLSIQIALSCPSNLYKIGCHADISLEKFNSSRLLSRRIALVGRLKEEFELKIGVLITNPLPDITSVMERLETYSKPRKHTLYFISMIQTIDECKIGNFDLCDAFIVINSCTCSTILESLVFNRPILTEHEYKLACGFEAEYGRVMWPGTSSHLAEDGFIINKRKVSDVSLALVHTRNELLERCSQARSNKWSGLEYKASYSGSDGDGSGDIYESLTVEKGLEGIASSYVSEPLKKVDSVKEYGRNRFEQVVVEGSSSNSSSCCDCSSKNALGRDTTVSGYDATINR